MSRTTSKVSHFQVGQFIVMKNSFSRSRFFRLHEVFPFLLISQSSIGIVIEIDAPHRILYHVFHNPVRRKDLCRGRNFISLKLTFLGKHLILAFTDVELVKPANQFRRTKLFVGDKLGLVQEVNKAIFSQNIGGKQQFSIVLHSAKAALQDRVGMAPCHQKHSKLFSNFRIVIKQFQKVTLTRLLHWRKEPLPGLVYNLRGMCRIGVCTYRFAKSVLL